MELKLYLAEEDLVEEIVMTEFTKIANEVKNTEMMSKYQFYMTHIIWLMWYDSYMAPRNPDKPTFRPPTVR